LLQVNDEPLYKCCEKITWHQHFGYLNIHHYNQARDFFLENIDVTRTPLIQLIMSDLKQKRLANTSLFKFIMYNETESDPCILS